MDEQGASASTNGSGQSVAVVISDSTARWLVIVLLALGVSYAIVESTEADRKGIDAQTEASLSKYYAIDMETYLYKQGLTPPPDPWRTKQRKEIKP